MYFPIFLLFFLFLFLFWKRFSSTKNQRSKKGQRFLGLGASLMMSSKDVFKSVSNLFKVSLISLASLWTRRITLSSASRPLEAFPAMDDVINCSMYDVSGTPCTMTVACCVMSVLFCGSSGWGA